MKEWTEQEINEILGLKGEDGERIDVFNLYGLLFIGNCLDEPRWNADKGRVEQRSMWNLDRRFCRKSSGSIGISLDDFYGCESEDDVHERFAEILKEKTSAQLL